MGQDKTSNIVAQEKSHTNIPDDKTQRLLSTTWNHVLVFHWVWSWCIYWTYFACQALRICQPSTHRTWIQLATSASQHHATIVESCITCIVENNHGILGREFGKSGTRARISHQMSGYYTLGTSRHTITVKIVDAKMMMQRSHHDGLQPCQKRIAESLVKDETGVIIVTWTDGTALKLQNQLLSLSRKILTCLWLSMNWWILLLNDLVVLWYQNSNQHNTEI